MRRLTFLFIIMLALISCQRLRDKSKEAIKESGNAVGQGASQFAEGGQEWCGSYLPVAYRGG